MTVFRDSHPIPQYVAMAVLRRFDEGDVRAAKKILAHHDDYEQRHHLAMLRLQNQTPN